MVVCDQQLQHILPLGSLHSFKNVIAFKGVVFEKHCYRPSWAHFRSKCRISITQTSTLMSSLSTGRIYTYISCKFEFKQQVVLYAFLQTVMSTLSFNMIDSLFAWRVSSPLLHKMIFAGECLIPSAFRLSLNVKENDYEKQITAPNIF